MCATRGVIKSIVKVGARGRSPHHTRCQGHDVNNAVEPITEGQSLQ